MATGDDVRHLALGLPGTTEGTSRGIKTWLVDGSADADDDGGKYAHDHVDHRSKEQRLIAVWSETHVVNHAVNVTVLP
jgi:hypothetical protein